MLAAVAIGPVGIGTQFEEQFDRLELMDGAHEEGGVGDQLGIFLQHVDGGCFVASHGCGPEAILNREVDRGGAVFNEHRGDFWRPLHHGMLVVGAMGIAINA